MKITIAFSLFFFLFACTDADRPKIELNPDKTEVEDKDSVSLGEDNEEESQKQPQTKEERIVEIKAMYGEFQIIERSDENICTEKTKKYTTDLVVEGMEFENQAKECQLEEGYSYKKVIENGYEWTSETIFYYKNDVLFFTFVSGASEGWAYEQRVYYDKDENVIMILEDENDHDGENPSIRKDVSSESRGGEILEELNGTCKAYEDIMSQD